MDVVGVEKISSFVTKHTDAKDWLVNWLSEVEDVYWKSPNDVKLRYPSVSILANCILIFNVKGNTYRLEVKIAFNTQVIVIIWLGTHAEYTKRYNKVSKGNR